MLTDDQIAALRSRFPILRQKTYLYNCSQGALSDAVEGGMQAFATSWRTSSAPWDDWMEAYESLRGAFARLVNAHPDEIAIIASASAGINPIANALSFAERNGVVMGEYEFPTMGHIWLAQRARGARVQFLDGVDYAVPIERYEQAIDARTRIVPLTQVSFVTGARSDVAAIAAHRPRQRRSPVPRRLSGLRHPTDRREGPRCGLLRDGHVEIPASGRPVSGFSTCGET